jgi:hypothetical protein
VAGVVYGVVVVEQQFWEVGLADILKVFLFVDYPHKLVSETLEAEWDIRTVAAFDQPVVFGHTSDVDFDILHDIRQVANKCLKGAGVSAAF